MSFEVIQNTAALVATEVAWRPVKAFNACASSMETPWCNDNDFPLGHVGLCRMVL